MFFTVFLIGFGCFLCFMGGYALGEKQGKYKSSIEAVGNAKAIAAVKNIFDDESDGATAVLALESPGDEGLSEAIIQACLDSGVDLAEGLPSGDREAYQRKILHLDEYGKGKCRGCFKIAFIACLEKCLCLKCKYSDTNFDLCFYCKARDATQGISCDFCKLKRESFLPDRN